jgi:hypothetical protein
LVFPEVRQAVGRERDADLAGLPLVPEQMRGRERIAFTTTR